MNIQELQTVAHYKIPLKMFILNNESYLTIKHTQKFFFDGYYAGSEPSSGYSAPDFVKVAEAYGITAYQLDSDKQCYLEAMLNHIFSTSIGNKSKNRPILYEVMMSADQPLIPVSMLDKSRGYVGTPIERMHPFLCEEEHRGNMLIEPV